jgi:1-acyl-sn-glycerol-3-phosphate acyltransferase
MPILKTAITSAIRVIFKSICRIDSEELTRVPTKGPLILIFNHINFLEVPVIYSLLYPRPIIGIAKQETWKNPLLGPLFNLWEMIPIKRGEVDLEAMQKSLKMLEDGKIVGISPEGTRSKNGQLLRGLPGVLLLALKSRAPILPVAHYGGEVFWDNFKRFKRTPFHIRVGEPFRLVNLPTPTPKDERELVMTEMMNRLAELLPPAYHGVYAGQDFSKHHYTEGLTLE